MKALIGVLFISGLVVTMIGLVSGEPLEAACGLVLVFLSWLWALAED